MANTRLCLVLFLLARECFYGQDTLQLNEITIKAYPGEQAMYRLPAPVVVIDSLQLHKQSGQSLVPVLNTVAGVRMEERSPGSYRLSIRGSLLRSPFGVRNTKVYVDEFPLTNAGGETYLNLFDVNCLHSFEILKGPNGSLFGANSGGVVRIGLLNNHQQGSFLTSGLQAGSNGFLGENFSVQKRFSKNVLTFSQGWQSTDGYRRNSAMERKYMHLINRLNYGKNSQLRVMLLFSDLFYQTPGGLTLSQYLDDPRMSRQATAVLPGAETQRARVLNRTVFGGAVNDLRITDKIRHLVSVFGSVTSFENAFITNYETREEKNAGTRTWLELKNNSKENMRFAFNIGGEMQYMRSEIYNYDNNRGERGNLRIHDGADVLQAFGFMRCTGDFNNKWMAEGSLSYNYNRFVFKRQHPFSAEVYKKELTPQLMPRFALSYLPVKILALRAVISRGYSPPSLQEIRSSTNEINLAIQPESGWNYETGFRLKPASARLSWDGSVFYYELARAIVRRITDAGQEYFVNAGATYQSGLESQLQYVIIGRRDKKILRGMEVTNAYTFSHFKFGSYSNGGADMSGNFLTGVPVHGSVTGITMQFPFGLYMFGQHNYTGRIPLNDLNSEFAQSYHLVQLKGGWKVIKAKYTLDINGGVDNLLNVKYSLGNDINAAGNRFYNSAPVRNYFIRISLGL